ncbi:MULTISPECIES: DUF6893 family small protein [unclassified Streptomyces]
MEAHMEWTWAGLAAVGLAMVYGVARVVPDVRRYLRIRRM